MGHVLAANSKKRRTRLDSVSEEKIGREAGSSLMEIAELQPGELLRSGTVEISKVLSARGLSSGSEMTSAALAPVVAQYLNSMWHGEYPK